MEKLLADWLQQQPAGLITVSTFFPISPMTAYKTGLFSSACHLIKTAQGTYHTNGTSTCTELHVVESPSAKGRTSIEDDLPWYRGLSNENGRSPWVEVDPDADFVGVAALQE
jgi:hypothetical protein